MMTVENEEV